MDLNQHYAALREKNRRLTQKRREECLQKCPELAMVMAQKAKAFLLPAGEALTALAKLKQHQKSLLKAMDLPDTYLDPIYDCPLCRDTGYVGSPVQKKCTCRLNLEQQKRMESGRINDREIFANFSADFYSDACQKARGEKICTLCRQYAEALPHPSYPQLILAGLPGLGKSFFGNAIAYQALEQGVESLRITAYFFIQDIMNGLKERISSLSTYMNVPFLVLDDLGSEPMIPNITVESIFALCDERRSAGRATVYITNLSLEELRNRYGERVSSRIADSAVTKAILFTGDSLRERKY